MKVPLWLRVLTRPHMWIRNEPTDKDWDIKLRGLLKSNRPYSRGCGFTVRLGGVPVWVQNWPYAYGYQFGGEGRKKLPSRRTALQLRDAMEKCRNILD